MSEVFLELKNQEGLDIQYDPDEIWISIKGLCGELLYTLYPYLKHEYLIRFGDYE